MGSLQTLLARAVTARSNKVLGWQAGPPKSREHDFPEKKNVGFSEIHWTSDTSLVSLALWKEAYGLYGTFTSQSIVCKVN